MSGKGGMKITLRPWRIAYSAAVVVGAFYLVGWLGVVIAFFASLDLTP
jgi:hypothetical protein